MQSTSWSLTHGTDNLTDTAAGTRCRCCCCKTAGGNENTRSPVFQTGANLPWLCEYPDAASRLAELFCRCRRLIEVERLAAPPRPLLPQYSTRRAPYFSPDRAASLHSTVSSRATARPQTQTRSHDSEQDDTSRARACVHFFSCDVNAFQLGPARRRRPRASQTQWREEND